MSSIIALIYMFNVAWMPFDQIGMYNDTVKIQQSIDNNTSVSFKLGLELFDIVTVYGGESTEQQAVGKLNFCPSEQQYYCGIDIHYVFKEEFKVSAGVYRECMHPVKAWREQVTSVDTASLELYLKIEGKIKLF